MNINFRVFRRNNKNLILLWNNAQLSDDQKVSLFAYAVDGLSDDRQLEWSKFVPDNPEKFAPDVDGIVIPHIQNKLNPMEKCTVKVVFGTGEESLEMVKDVMPANAVIEPSRSATETHGQKRMFLYAKDYRTGEWVPWPVDGKMPDNVQFQIKES